MTRATLTLLVVTLGTMPVGGNTILATGEAQSHGAGAPRTPPQRSVASKATSQPTPPALQQASRALDAGDGDRALALVSTYLATHPSSARAHVLAARVYIGRDDLDRAYDELRLAVRSDPRDADALYYLGVVTGRLASDTMQRLTETAPNSARVHQMAAEALELQSRRPEAEREYEAALAVKPDLFDALLGLAKLKRIRLECKDAIALYERAEAVRPSYDAAYGLGVCHSYDQDDEHAVASFRLAIERDPRSALAWSGLGTATLKLGRAAEAITQLRRAIALEPRMSEAYYALGRAYQATGDSARAREAFAQAEQVRSEPDAAPAAPATQPQEPH